MIKNTLPDKSGNPESLKSQSQQFESFSTNVPLVGEICRGRSTDCFIYSFAIQMISEKYCAAKFYWQFEIYFYLKIIVTIDLAATDLATNSLLSSFFPFLKPKTRIKFSAS